MERNYYFYIAIVLTIVIAIGSLTTVNKAIPEEVHFSDKVIHMVAYFLLTMSWFLAFHKKTNKLKYSALIGFLVLIYGIIIEVLQGALTTFRQADVYDIWANLGGILLALFSLNLFFRKKRVI